MRGQKRKTRKSDVVDFDPGVFWVYRCTLAQLPETPYEEENPFSWTYCCWRCSRINDSRVWVWTESGFFNGERRTGGRINAHKHTNRLANEKSPYLLQHAHNPVNWYPWGLEAFKKARKEQKPIFLSVAYSTCHWCHVMERESFENEAIAKILNKYFVSIKVDREERPDLDRIYMAYVQATTGGGGWPMSVCLTPGLKPFFGGTYFPPDEQWGRPGFPSVLERIATAWRASCRSLLRWPEVGIDSCGGVEYIFYIEGERP